MKYRIDDCTIGGVINPTLTLIGWVENKAERIIIKSNNKVINEIVINKIRQRVTTFHYEIPLEKGLNKYEIYFCDVYKKESLVKSITTNKMQRLIHKYESSFKFIKSYRFYNRKLKKKIKNYYRNTIDYKDSEQYTHWLKKHQSFYEVEDYSYNPKISIVMPVYNVPGEYLGYCIDSILNQTYQNFEICIADDCSTNQDTIDTLHRYMNKDSRVKVIFRPKNGHISRATNSALELVTGDYIGLMDNDDKLEKHALNEVVHVLNENPDIDFIYTDEDKVDMEGNRSDPHFKTDFAIDSLYGGNFICHFSVIRKSLIDQIGGFRQGYEGAQDFDLFLRLTEVTNKIYHIPKILYHWRMIPGSTAVGGDGAKNYAADAGKRALEDYFDKKQIKVNIDNFISTNYFVEYLFDKEPEVEILVYNYQNQREILESIKKMTVFENYHMTTLDQNKTIKEINQIIQSIKSDYLIFIDANSEIVSVDWIDILVGYASQKHIGVVGCKVVDDIGLVKASGYHVSLKDNKIYTNGPLHYKDYGYNGRLLIPYDYTLVENKVMAVEKNKFSDLSTNYSLSVALYDLQLKLLARGYNNVMVPQVEIVNYDEDDQNKIELILKQYHDCIAKVNYYNPNFMIEKAYCLEKVGGQ